MTDRSDQDDRSSGATPAPDLTLTTLTEHVGVTHVDVVIEDDSVEVIDDVGDVLGAVAVRTAGRTTVVRVPAAALVCTADDQRYRALLESHLDEEWHDLSRVRIDEVRAVHEAVADLDGPLVRAVQELVDLVEQSQDPARILITETGAVLAAAVACLPGNAEDPKTLATVTSIAPEDRPEGGS